MQTTKRRILVVDDNDDTCFLLTVMLDRAGYEVTAANTVADAFNLARSSSFDLYLLDMYYADGTGIELCQKIREFDSRIPIVFFTGAAAEQDKQKALSVCAQSYLLKPDNLNEIEATVANLIGGLTKEASLTY